MGVARFDQVEIGMRRAEDGVDSLALPPVLGLLPARSPLSQVALFGTDEARWHDVDLVCWVCWESQASYVRTGSSSSVSVYRLVRGPAAETSVPGAAALR